MRVKRIKIRDRQGINSYATCFRVLVMHYHALEDLQRISVRPSEVKRVCGEPYHDADVRVIFSSQVSTTNYRGTSLETKLPRLGELIIARLSWDLAVVIIIGDQLNPAYRQSNMAPFGQGEKLSFSRTSRHEGPRCRTVLETCPCTISAEMSSCARYFRQSRA